METSDKILISRINDLFRLSEKYSCERFSAFFQQYRQENSHRHKSAEITEQIDDSDAAADSAKLIGEQISPDGCEGSEITNLIQIFLQRQFSAHFAAEIAVKKEHIE